MSERASYNDGEFCWVDLATPDTEKSASFYGELFGWEFEPAEAPEGVDTGGYGNFTYKGKRVAGMGKIMQEGQPPTWSSYVKVSDADSTADKVKEAGGAVLMGPVDVPGEAGRMAVCRDAEGAFFSIWQPNRHQGAELVNEIGAWTWNELGSRDLEAAKRFYGEVFGWTLERAPEAPPDVPYQMWHTEGQKWEEGLAGGHPLGDETPADFPPHWMVNLCVEDAAKAVEFVRGAGGQVMAGPMRIPVGEYAVLADPDGAPFAIIEPDYPEAR